MPFRFQQACVTYTHQAGSRVCCPVAHRFLPCIFYDDLDIIGAVAASDGNNVVSVAEDVTDSLDLSTSGASKDDEDRGRRGREGNGAGSGRHDIF